MAEATTAYEITAKVGDRIKVVKMQYVPAVVDVKRILNLDASVVPIINGRVANGLTRLVPNAVVEFLV